MKNLRVESTSISWDFNEATVSINEGYLIKGTQYIASEKLLLVLAGERGVVQNLLAYNEDGSLKFSLYPPKGFFFYFTDVNGIGVTCGHELSEIQNYHINFNKMSLEKNGL